MNYLAHSLACLDDPYEVAGAAVPDWLGLTRPRLRCRSRYARPWVDHADPQLAAIARGVVRHHADDDWFHQTPAFGDLTLELARRIRRITGDTDGMRPSFLGHILLELLLDAALHEDRPEVLDRYYDVLATVDPSCVSQAVTEMTDADAGQLTTIITKFLELRFLYDYADDERLLFRINQVMRRVGLPPLADEFLTVLPGARELVASRRDDLLTPLASLAISEA
jgi:hypothetical protein